MLPVLILSACDGGSGTETSPRAESEGVQSAAGSHRSVEVSFVGAETDGLEELLRQLQGETLGDNRWTRIYEQELGIKIKYDWTAKGDLYQKKLGVAVASGNIPDVVKVNAQQLRLLTNKGLIQELSQVYEQYASPLTKDILSQEGSGPFDAATIDGRLMAIPETNSSIDRAQLIWIRTDWLSRLGLQPPQTIDDVLAISKAFTSRDPDRNGQPDTFGLAVTQNLWDPAMGITGFMAGYGAFPNLWVKNSSGELEYGGIQPEVKTALLELQNMYRSGQIDSEFGMKDSTKVGKQIAAGKIGMLYGEQWSAFGVQGSRGSAPSSEWQAFPLVSKSGAPPQVPLRFSTWQFYAVRKDVPHPEAVVQLFNLHLEKNWGASAAYETYYISPLPVWQLSPVTPYPARKNLEAFQQLDKARRTGDFSFLKEEARAIKKRLDAYASGGPDKESGWGWEKIYGPNGAYGIIDGYEHNHQLLTDGFNGALTDTMMDRQSILNELQDEAFIRIILGRPIDEFDRFVEEWRRLGGDRMTEEVNRWRAEKGRERSETD
ncbi:MULTISPECIES: extracellular solute-binding protein [Paenibacillus]|uniref:extracellular solute-binding protein n=1 Tax=Paenibacillus TaxID=44249 RepID=UPI0022B86CEA|nr:extracellular solute-binding protein [Paenibacillus caseinilyticus]MCZ8521307.1 extracellular solute-binding protein [Paenibacillus caseinilyticus]